jgi:hypothetical protein
MAIDDFRAATGPAQSDRKAKRDLTIRTKGEAVALGLKHYYSGRPCKHGHIAPRATVNGTCLECVSVRHAEWRKRPHASERMKAAAIAHRERHPDYQRQRYWRDPAKAIASSIRAARKNPDAARRRKSAWKKRNPHKVAADRARRRATELMATPHWLTDEHWRQIEAIYRLAAARDGGPWQVDHIVPLQGKTVCGLHVPWNLQILSAAENCRKQNKLNALTCFADPHEGVDFLKWKRRKEAA